MGADAKNAMIASPSVLVERLGRTDVLNGGARDDTFSDGTGNDRFLFAEPAGTRSPTSAAAT
jgi:hypothetical protein